ncbi:thyrotroph embryonic factor isoform X1 [Latimeria chalumnae]|uniref:TEF transcription factor, PAR bZIP family member n=1 Tax=Latimeria chalumnae TaxID=7897 RepID=H3AXR3_LATCH|nr:PREDICTED: thyrotroph embryonic factor isoform X2 [Latimeria chalumnae]|eukprot:XP_006002024.1 PREDICTED: thyrotroph embryonic factor isoform X2 [Latimeria chalumnae]
MSGEAVETERGGSTLLEKLMANPPQKLLETSLGGEGEGKEKVLDDDEAAGSPLGVSASLMPTIWDKTIPYDGETFHLEYMDLDEFLLENGIPNGPSEIQLNEDIQNPLMPVVELEDKDTASTSSSSSSESSLKVVYQPSENSKSAASPDDDRNAPSSVDPEAVEVDVNFNPDPTDLVLSSIPGGEVFDPRKHKFTEDDLKPQPMIKKAKKVFVPDEQKDDKYWSRRRKNNIAAKRSRDARRLKENQIVVRAAFLEKENMALKTEVAELRKEVGKCKNIISKYEGQYGAL